MVRSWILVLVLLVQACSVASNETIPTQPLTKTVVEVTKYVVYDCGTPPSVDAFAALEVEWKVLKTRDGVYRYTLSAEEYEKLGKNMSGVVVSTRQLRAQRDFYRDCIRKSVEATENNT